MLKNYLTIAYRNLIRRKGFSIINISGLSVGLAICTLIMLWMIDETSFDKVHENYERIHRILVNIDNNGEDYRVAVTAAALAPNIIGEVPEFEEICRFKNWGPFQIQYENNKYVNLRSGIADPSVFKIFTFPLNRGNPETALNDAHSIVLTKESAKKIFDDEDPIGKVVQVQNRGDFTITGVMEDVSHSHFDFEFLTPFHLIKEDGENIDDPGMGSYNFTTYVLLTENAVASEAEEKIENYLKVLDPEDGPSLFLQPLKDIYLHSDFAYDFTIRGDIKIIYIFSFIAFLVLMIACINFMNLSIAKSITRALEIGIRKVSGSNRSTIVFQFFTESLLFTFIAMIISVFLTEMLLPQFNEFTGKLISSNIFRSPKIIFYLFSITIITGIISGIYPAILLSSFVPIKVLKSKSNNNTSSRKFRTVLVVLQFSLSIILLIAAFTIQKQLEFINKKDLGYNKHHLVYTYFTPTLKEKYDLVKENLLKFPEVTNVTCTDVLPVYECPGSSVTTWEGKQQDRSVPLHQIQVGYDYLETFEINLKEGKAFSEDLASGDFSLLLNEEAVKQMGIEDPIGKTVYEENAQIIGVIKDFHFNNIRSKIEPLAIFLNKDQSRNLFVRINPDNAKETLEKMNEELKKIDPDTIWMFRFFDDTLEKLYNKEQKTGQLITFFTIIAIFISCLGLFGLAGYITERRTKEIGIRKVMGASVSHIIYRLTIEFCKWVLVSIIISWIASYFMMNKWLQNFAYHTDISYFLFFISGIMALMISIITVSFHTLKVANSNPVKALKYE